MERLASQAAPPDAGSRDVSEPQDPRVLWQVDLNAPEKRGEQPLQSSCMGPW